MLKKLVASVVTAAFVIAGPGHLTLDAAAQTIGRPTAVTLTPTLPSVTAPVNPLGSSSLNAAVGSAVLTPSFSAASAVPLTAAAAPFGASAVSAAVPVSAKGFRPVASAAGVSPIFADAKAPEAAKAAELNRLFDASNRTGYETLEVVGQTAASESRLEKSVLAAEKTAASVPSKDQSGSGVVETGIIAAVIAVAAGAIFSPAFREILKRIWNSTLGRLGRWAKRTETPENMAQRIVDELNRQKPIYSQKVSDAIEKAANLRKDIEKNEKDIAELEESVRAILSDSDPNNDDMAIGMVNSKNTLISSTEMLKTAHAAALATVEEIKAERARFFQERQEKLAQVQAGLSRAKAAELRIEIEKLKGGYDTGDLKDSMDKFEQAVNEKEAKAEGMKGSSESNPEEQLKKAKEQYRNQKAKDEIEKIKKEIEAKKNGGSSQSGAAVKSGDPIAKNSLYIRIGAAAVALLVTLAAVPVAIQTQLLGQIATMFVLNLIFGKSDKKKDAIVFAAAMAALVLVGLVAPAATLATAVGMVGGAYLLFLLFA